MRVCVCVCVCLCLAFPCVSFVCARSLVCPYILMSVCRVTLTLKLFSRITVQFRPVRVNRRCHQHVFPVAFSRDSFRGHVSPSCVLGHVFLKEEALDNPHAITPCHLHGGQWAVPHESGWCNLSWSVPSQFRKHAGPETRYACCPAIFRGFNCFGGQDKQQTLQQGNFCIGASLFSPITPRVCPVHLFLFSVRASFQSVRILSLRAFSLCIFLRRPCVFFVRVQVIFPSLSVGASVDLSKAMPSSIVCAMLLVGELGLVLWQQSFSNFTKVRRRSQQKHEKCEC